MAKTRKAGSVLFLAVIAALIIAGYDVIQHLYRPLPFSSPVDYHLTPGTSVKQLVRQLHAQGIIERPRYLELYARAAGLDARLQAGEYRLQPGLTAVGVLQQMHRGDVTQYPFTIVEGWTFKQLRVALAKQSLLTQTLKPADSDAEVMQKLGYGNQHPEGRFYPDTYLFARDTTDVVILRRAYTDMQRALERQWQQRAPGLPLRNAYEALILASIVERESALPSERPLVAAVFINRLNKGMRLQTDPTVIYGMGDRFDGDIRSRDLREDTPYNTYTRGGLPPTPIAMPGEAAIHASLHPADSPVLYFVAKGEPDGSHYFSTNLSDHNAAVDRYQRKRNSR